MMERGMSTGSRNSRGRRRRSAQSHAPWASVTTVADQPGITTCRLPLRLRGPAPHRIRSAQPWSRQPASDVGVCSRPVCCHRGHSLTPAIRTSTDPLNGSPATNREHPEKFP